MYACLSTISGQFVDTFCGAMIKHIYTVNKKRKHFQFARNHRIPITLQLSHWVPLSVIRGEDADFDLMRLAMDESLVFSWSNSFLCNIELKSFAATFREILKLESHFAHEPNSFDECVHISFA